MLGKGYLNRQAKRSPMKWRHAFPSDEATITKRRGELKRDLKRSIVDSTKSRVCALGGKRLGVEQVVTISAITVATDDERLNSSQSGLSKISRPRAPRYDSKGSHKSPFGHDGYRSD